MSAIEQELIESIKQMDDTEKQHVLDFIRKLKMPRTSYTLEELKKMPPEQRNKAVIEALGNAQHKDVELFDAFGEADFHDD